jgi:hypothetical protein
LTTDRQLSCCAALCGLSASSPARSPHHSALLPVALAALDTDGQANSAHSGPSSAFVSASSADFVRRAAVVLLGLMVPGCTEEEAGAISAVEFVDASIAMLGLDTLSTPVFSQLIHALELALQWPESAVDSARLHPLVQRMVDGGLLPLMEGQCRIELTFFTSELACRIRIDRC